LICSHAWRFVFLKTRKTAGTSVEIALSRFCGPLDVVTPLAAVDEALRFEHCGDVARNYAPVGMQVPTPTEQGDLVSFFQGQGADVQVRGQFYNHQPARQVRPLLGERLWGGYFRFTIERDPFTRLPSQYFWQTQNTPDPPDFSTWLRGPLPIKNSNQAIYVDQGGLAVNFVVDFARLEEDLALLAETFGWPLELPLPRAKSGVRRGRTVTWTEADRAVVRERFATEIKVYEMASKGVFRDRVLAARSS